MSHLSLLDTISISLVREIVWLGGGRGGGDVGEFCREMNVFLSIHITSSILIKLH